MKRFKLIAGLLGLTAGLVGAGLLGFTPATAQDEDAPRVQVGKKNVPIITMGSNLNVGIAQVEGPRSAVNSVKVVAQLETDYKDVARLRILVPISTKKVVKNIKRVPGVAVVGLADYTIIK